MAAKPTVAAFQTIAINPLPPNSLFFLIPQDGGGKGGLKRKKGGRSQMRPDLHIYGRPGIGSATREP